MEVDEVFGTQDITDMAWFFNVVSRTWRIRQERWLLDLQKGL